MKPRLAYAALTALLTVATVAGARADEITWGKDLTAAQTAAKQSHKLMMVDMYTGWCGWCKKLDADVYPQPTVVQAAAQFVPLKLDAEKDADGVTLAKKFKVTGFPTLLFLDGSGAIVDRIVGYQPVADFVTSLKKVQQNYTDFPQLQAQVKADPTNVAASTKLAAALLGRDRLSDAVAIVTTLEQGGKGTGLGDLDNQIASAYSDQDDQAKAMAWYKKTLANSKVTDELQAAHIGLYEGYAHQKNQAGMITELKAIAALPGVSPQLKAGVEAMLKKLQTPATAAK